MLDKLPSPKKVKKSVYKRVLPELQIHLRNAAQATRDAGIPVAIIFEGWRAGWGSVISHNIAETLAPYTKLHLISAANEEERLHPWLWRFWKKLPANGEWAIFDQSWYWRVLYERVEEGIPEKVWRRNYRDIIEFERALTGDGMVILKSFLHLPKQQLKRRLEKLQKKFSKTKKVATEAREQLYHYGKWTAAYQEMFERTDTQWAPWTQTLSVKRRTTTLQIYNFLLATVKNYVEVPDTLPPPGNADSQ